MYSFTMLGKKIVVTFWIFLVCLLLDFIMMVQLK